MRRALRLFVATAIAEAATCAHRWGARFGELLGDELFALSGAVMRAADPPIDSEEIELATLGKWPVVIPGRSHPTPGERREVPHARA